MGLVIAMLLSGTSSLPASAQTTDGKSTTTLIVTIKKTIPLPPPRPSSFGTVPKIDSPKPEPTLIAPVPQTFVLTPKPTPPSALKPAPITKVVPQDVSSESLLTKVNASLNTLTAFTAKFSQISANGQQAKGTLAVIRPGRLRFDYNPPSAIKIIADGNSVAILDEALKTQDVYSIGLTPLKFLLRSKIDLASDTHLLDIHTEGDRVWALIEDSSTFGGSSRIALGFDSKTLQLKQWTVTDPQGYDVQVMLTGIDTQHDIDQSQFIIPSNERMPQKK